MNMGAKNRGFTIETPGALVVSDPYVSVCVCFPAPTVANRIRFEDVQPGITSANGSLEGLRLPIHRKMFVLSGCCCKARHTVDDIKSCITHNKEYTIFPIV